MKQFINTYSPILTGLVFIIIAIITGRSELYIAGAICIFMGFYIFIAVP